MFGRIIPALYIIVGVFVAAQHDYFANLNTLSHIVSAALAILLWPLLLLGVNLNIK